nr:unnamed protein product [Spirometra erinaceieuropaei]
MQEPYPVKLWWKCGGVPNLQNQRVAYLEEAAKQYYMARTAGRDFQDRMLEQHVPPSSILTHDKYKNLLRMVLEEPDEGLGSQIMMRMNCELFNDLEWAQEEFENTLSRSTAGVRGILDTIYRMGLCIRGIDKHLNCPDVCRARGPKFCANATHSLKICGTITPDELSRYSSEKEPDDATKLSDEFKKWHAAIPMSKRFPLEFFERFVENKVFFKNVFEAQLQAAQIPFCICENFFKYDLVLKACVEDAGESACGAGNPCMNGGECTKPDPSKAKKSSSSKRVANPLFECKCLPAFAGTLCENDVNPCIKDDGIKFCAPFRCARAPENIHKGFRCLCPPRTHRPRNPTDPSCVPLPACGKDGLSSGPCEHGGRCIQDTSNPLEYRCQCPSGYSGKRCENPPPEPFWSTWSGWSNCKWPKPAEACLVRAYRESTRTCTAEGLGQVCQGASRRIRYTGCDIDLSTDEVRNSLTSEEREKLQQAFAMCPLSFSGSGSEYHYHYLLLSDPRSDQMMLDDWSDAGPEEATVLLFPESFRSLDRESMREINWPQEMDLLYLGAWFYGAILLIGLVIAWISKLRTWILQAKGVYED